MPDEEIPTSWSNLAQTEVREIMENRPLPRSCLAVLVLFLGTLALYVLVGVIFAPIFILAALVFLFGIIGTMMLPLLLITPKRDSDHP